MPSSFLASEVRKCPLSHAAGRMVRHGLAGEFLQNWRDEPGMETVPAAKGVFSRADQTSLRTAFGIGSACDRLPKLLARDILIDGRHCGDRKQPHEEFAFHVCFC